MSIFPTTMVGRGSNRVGQFRNIECPLCGTTDKTGKWTCKSCTHLVAVHRGLIKNLQLWHSLFEAQQVPEVLMVAEGVEYCLWDADSFYATRIILAPQQRTAIELCLYQNMLESDAAIKMGISSSCPVLVYATIGLTYMLAEQGLAGANTGQGFSVSIEDLEGALV